MSDIRQLEGFVAMRRIAASTGVYTGLMNSYADRRYLHACRALWRPGSMTVIYTRDIGHHSSGWWKNPDFERCLHLSVSFIDLLTFEPAQYKAAEAAKMAKAFFGDDIKKCWVEPPFSPEGKARDVHHYRVFCNAAWEPLKPRGEVYTKAYTEAGFKTFSEIHGEEKAKRFVPPYNEGE